jgi:hypothetical protein
MFSLMLDLGFKIFCFVSSLIVHESKGRPLLKNMIANLYFLCLLNVILISILWLNLKRGIVNQVVDRSLDIFEMTNNTSEPTMKLIIRELLIFMHHQVDIKDIKCPL